MWDKYEEVVFEKGNKYVEFLGYKTIYIQNIAHYQAH